MIKSQAWILGPLLSIAGAYLQYRRKDVGQWMKARRIDQRRTLNKCEFCGSKLNKPVALKNTGKKASTCIRYPDCRYVRWD